MPHKNAIHPQKVLMLAVCLLTVGTLAACGVKPKAIKAPSTATTAYPATYPAERTVK